jgi:tetratricopeptide (TPR) repeat protein
MMGRADSVPKNSMPTHQERENQLGRILLSRTFAEAFKLAPLLKHLGECELNGTTVDEYTVGIDVFGKPTDWVPMHEATVRESFRNLVKRLALYYEEEGKDDLVIVEFPKRSGYRPRFSYNPRSGAIEAVRRALYRRDHEFPDLVSCGTIAVQLEDCIEASPAYAPAYLALAETLLLYTMCDETTGFPVRQSVDRAEKAISRCLELDDTLWRAHVVAGAIHCCRFAWDKATGAFKTALELAPDDTRAHLWYAAFLMAAGRVEEAKQCITWRRKRMPESRFTGLIRPLFLYVMREYKQAQDELMLLSPSFPKLLSDAGFYSGDSISSFDIWLAELLMACLSLAQNQSRGALQYAEAAVMHSGAGAFNGLIVFARAGLGRLHPDITAQAENLLERIEREDHCHSALSLAVAYMGVSRTEEAIQKLHEACDDGHPLMAWLHLWPLFDPLCAHPAFKRLIASRNLPS